MRWRRDIRMQRKHIDLCRPQCARTHRLKSIGSNSRGTRSCYSKIRIVMTERSTSRIAEPRRHLRLKSSQWIPKHWYTCPSYLLLGSPFNSSLLSDTLQRPRNWGSMAFRAQQSFRILVPRTNDTGYLPRRNS